MNLDRPLVHGLWASDDALSVGAAEAVDRFGVAALGQIDLPPLDEFGGPSRGELCAASALLWCRHLEEAGLPDFVDALAARALEGSLTLCLTERGSERLAAYHRGRAERWTRPERLALYSRLFGGPGAPDPNASFDGSLRGLAERLVATPAGLSQPWHAVAVATAAEVLRGSLAPRVGGITRFAAERIVAHIREALDVLADPGVRAALGGRTPMQTISWHAREVLGREVSVVASLVRADAGALLLRWLADNIDAVHRGSIPVTSDDPAVQAAARWLSP